MAMFMAKALMIWSSWDSGSVAPICSVAVEMPKSSADSLLEREARSLAEPAIER